MERIKQALRRAREEFGERARNETEGPDARSARAGPGRIEYRETRVVDVPAASLIKKRVVAWDEAHSAAGAYKLLRTQVLQRMQANNCNSLAITSPAPAEGKSLTAVNLAVSIAQQFANTVLLVDLDLRRPAIASYFDYQPARGLTDHLLKGVPLNEVLFNPGMEHLVVLPAGAATSKASELLRSPEMHAFSRELKARYPDRFVLFDLPPLLVGDDALSFLSCVDCVLMVIEDGKTHPDELIRAAELLGETPLIGSVLNKSTDAELNHYYRYY